MSILSIRDIERASLPHFTSAIRNGGKHVICIFHRGTLRPIARKSLMDEARRHLLGIYFDRDTNVDPIHFFIVLPTQGHGFALDAFIGRDFNS